MKDIRGLCERAERDPARLSSWQGLSVRDGEVLRRWIVQLEGVDRLWTDILVGPVPEWEETAVWTAEAHQQCYCYRVDVVIEKNGMLWGAELKPYASPHAIGQVCVYRHWWKRTGACRPVAEWLIVAGTVDEPIRGVAAELGIRLVEVGSVTG